MLLKTARPQNLSGVLGVVLLGTALALPGPPPKASDSAAALRATLVNHRGAFVTGMLVAGLGFAALIWFVACVASAVRESESPDSSRPAVALGGGLAATILMFIGMATFAGAAFRTAALGDQFVVRAAVDTGNMLIEASKFGFAVLIVATCVGEALPSLSSRLRTAGLVAAGALVLSAVPPFVVERGVGQFGGPIDLAGTVPALLWLSVLSISLAKTRWAFRLRWAPGPSRRTAGVVSATQTDFARFRDIPGAVLAALRLRRLVRGAPGAIGVSLSMHPLRKRGWSVSAWETEADLRGFLRSTAHQATARRFRSRVVVRSELWAVDRFDLAAAWHQADACWTNGA